MTRAPHRPRRPRRPRRTVRLRLTLWYSALFLVSGAALLAITYGLMAQALIGQTGAAAACRAPGTGCHAIPASQIQAAALQAQLHALLTRSGLALAIMTVLSVALGWFIAGRALGPLRAITSAAREISAASLGRRLALGGPDDELKELADTIDGLLARLEASFRGQRRFIANAAHELRTPLARQRVISQVALADPDATSASLRAAHERVLASGAEQNRLIDALLTLARGQAGLDTREPFDLAEVTARVLAARQAEARDRRLTVEAALGPAPATGSPGLAGQMAANLVDNALRHNVAGGRVEVATTTANGRAVLTVANTGPAIPADQVERLFQPFRRLAADRTGGGGLGLGLSIVQAIAEAHGAAIAARRRPGGGLSVEVAFTAGPVTATAAANARPAATATPPAKAATPG
jgi:signal transduction histidine kinase